MAVAGSREEFLSSHLGSASNEGPQTDQATPDEKLWAQATQQEWDGVILFTSPRQFFWFQEADFPASFSLRRASLHVTKGVPLMTTATVINAQPAMKAIIYCPLCTHTVDGQVRRVGKQIRVVPGQKCARCSSSLDAGYVFQVNRAA